MSGPERFILPALGWREEEESQQTKAAFSQGKKNGVTVCVF
jgi:hypothetical protein